MSKVSKSQINDISKLLLFILFIGILVYSFRQQIASWFSNALVQLAKETENTLIQLGIAIGIIILALVPLAIGYSMIKHYVENGTIYTSTAKWACFILAAAGLWILSEWTIGYYIGDALSLFLFGILAYFVIEAIRDLI